MKTCTSFVLCVFLVLAVSFSGMLQAQTIQSSGQNGIHFPKASTLSVEDKLVGEEVCFDLTARDKNGNIIRSWDNTGNMTTLTLRNSTANTDTNKQSWNADPQGFSYAYITQNNAKLIQMSDSEWALPSTAFVDGQTRVCLTDTKAESGIYLEISPKVGGLKQISDTTNFLVDAISNYLVEITSNTPAGNQVFHMRPYEVVVSPRDRFLNVSNQTIRTRFSARWPGEFDNTSPNLADIFANDVFITGPTNYLIASRIVRMLPNELPQIIIAFSADNVAITGQTSPYEILSHAPVPFNLLTPPNHSIVNLEHAADQVIFTWEKPTPADPYTNIQVSRFDPTTFSDEVRYTWVIVDSSSLTNAQRIASDDGGQLPKLTLTCGQLQGIMTAISGMSNTKSYSFAWFVEATDGLYTTKSSPLPGFYLTMITDLTSVQPQPSIPAHLALGQNYPNPFNPSTTISFSTTMTGKVSLKVYDLFGKEIATVVNGTMEAGRHSATLSAEKLTSGMYIYKLSAEGKTFTRRMTVLK